MEFKQPRSIVVSFYFPKDKTRGNTVIYTDNRQLATLMELSNSDGISNLEQWKGHLSSALHHTVILFILQMCLLNYIINWML